MSVNLADPDFAAAIDAADAWAAVAPAERYTPRRWHHSDGRDCQQGDACNKRACECCQWRQALGRVHTILPHIQSLGRSIYMLTLTRPAEVCPYAAHRSAQKLVADFAKLSRRSWWRQNISGGVRSLHVGHGPDGWTPHLHLIVEARRDIDGIDLGREYGEASGERLHVYARKVGNTYADRRRAVTYSLGPSIRNLDPRELCNYQTITNRVRGYGVFGGWRDFTKASPTPEATTRVPATPTKTDYSPILILSRLSRPNDGPDKSPQTPPAEPSAALTHTTNTSTQVNYSTDATQPRTRGGGVVVGSSDPHRLVLQSGGSGVDAHQRPRQHAARPPEISRRQQQRQRLTAPRPLDGFD